MRTLHATGCLSRGTFYDPAMITYDTITWKAKKTLVQLRQHGLMDSRAHVIYTRHNKEHPNGVESG